MDETELSYSLLAEPAEPDPLPTSRSLEQTIAQLRQYLDGEALVESEAALRRMYARSARWAGHD